MPYKNRQSVEARRAYARATRRKAARRTEAMRALKSGPCMDCGGRFHPSAMHFDHLPGTEKIADVSRLRFCTWKTVVAEIAKCELVCANCHAVRTHQRDQLLRAKLAEARGEW